MIRDLVEIAVGMVKQEQRRQVENPGRRACAGTAPRPCSAAHQTCGTRRTPRRTTAGSRSRDKMKARLDAGELEDRPVEMQVEQKAAAIPLFSSVSGMENMGRPPEHVREDPAAPDADAPGHRPRGPGESCSNRKPRRSFDREVVSEKAVELVEIRGSSSSTRSTRSAARPRRTVRTCRARACSATCSRSSRGRR